jgi:hypothetical protein
VARPTHRLDLCVVPADPDRPVDPAAARALVAAWRAAPPAGARAVRVDLPGEVSLYANQMGGFRVRCPETGDNLVPVFGGAVRVWRAGGERRLACPACGREHALESLDYAPDAAFAMGGVVLADVRTASLDADAQATAAAHLGGPVRVIGKRTN